MYYYVDGYNFIFSLYEEVDPLREKRDEVIDYLQSTLEDLKFSVSIVFDSHHRDDAFFPKRYRRSSLEIIYTTSGQSADNYILESLSFLKTRSNITVVTSDKFLAKQVKLLGAKVLTISAFIKLVVKKHDKIQQIEIKQNALSDNDFQRLLEAFEKSFNELDK